LVAGLSGSTPDLVSVDEQSFPDAPSLPEAPLMDFAVIAPSMEQSAAEAVTAGRDRDTTEFFDTGRRSAAPDHVWSRR